MDTFKISFGRKLKQIRKSKGFTQEKLSERVEINLRQLARIEAGESFVTAETLQKICSTLEIAPDALFRFTTNTVQQNSRFIELIHKIDMISDDENKLEFMRIALDAMSNKNSLEQLKLLIKGLELKM